MIHSFYLQYFKWQFTVSLLFSVFSCNATHGIPNIFILGNDVSQSFKWLIYTNLQSAKLLEVSTIWRTLGLCLSINVKTHKKHTKSIKIVYVSNYSSNKVSQRIKISWWSSTDLFVKWFILIIFHCNNWVALLNQNTFVFRSLNRNNLGSDLLVCCLIC